ncbi:MAG: cell envelope integrity protein TolA [Deltaproteobacteria bacterium]|nr:cell envelope integrity protein TolA [Deltaproteobacteria bacterium]
MSPPAYALLGPGVDNRTLLIGGLVSVAIHLAVLLWLVWWPGFSNNYETLGPIYTVDLVGPPGPPPPPAPAGEQEAAPAEPEAVPVKEVAKVKAPEPAELIPIGKDKDKIEPEVESLIKLGTPKKSSKDKEVKPEEEIDKALAKIEKKVDSKEKKKSGQTQSEEDRAKKHLEQAFARARQRVEAGAYGLGGGGGTGQGDNRYALYYTQVWQRVRSNWTLPEDWQKKDLEAVVVIEVLPNGAITSIRFEKRSGLASFDQSVRWAVERSNPLPPFPAGLGAGVQEIGIRFHPEG